MLLEVNNKFRAVWYNGVQYEVVGRDVKVDEGAATTPAVSVAFNRDDLSRISDWIDAYELVIYLTTHFIRRNVADNFVCCSLNWNTCHAIGLDLVQN